MMRLATYKGRARPRDEARGGGTREPLPHRLRGPSRRQRTPHTATRVSPPRLHMDRPDVPLMAKAWSRSREVATTRGRRGDLGSGFGLNEASGPPGDEAKATAGRVRSSSRSPPPPPQQQCPRCQRVAARHGVNEFPTGEQEGPERLPERGPSAGSGPDDSTRCSSVPYERNRPVSVSHESPIEDRSGLSRRRSQGAYCPTR